MWVLDYLDMLLQRIAKHINVLLLQPVDMVHENDLHTHAWREKERKLDSSVHILGSS